MASRDKSGKFVKQGGPIKVNVASKKIKIRPATEKENAMALNMCKDYKDMEIEHTAIVQADAIAKANEAAFLLHLVKSEQGTNMKISVDVKKNYGFSHSEFGFRPTKDFMTDIMKVVYKHYRQEGNYVAKINEAKELMGKRQADVIDSGLNEINKIEEEVKFL